MGVMDEDEVAAEQEFQNACYELFSAVELGNVEKVKEIIDQDTSYTDVQNERGQTPMHVALDILSVFLFPSMKPKHGDPVKLTTQRFEIIRYLFEKDADLTFLDQDGCSVRDVAARNGFKNLLPKFDQAIRAQHLKRLRVFLLGTHRNHASVVRLLPVDVLSLIVKNVCAADHNSEN
eukprot:c4364_g1_i1.p1 GENE.c4364_g1_i1~~c4364_g1_i1.p1  ORF type:complete len:177 (-),score=45.70 c4364_g1_i1:54-584(-)